MFTIIGGDGREYGPISGEDLRKWIAEGRLDAQSLAKAEGDAEFRPLSAFPEFAGTFAPQTIAPLALPAFAASADFLEGDYELDLGGYIGRGWELFKNNFGTLFLAALIYNLIEGGIALFGMIPFIGPLFSLANLFVAGPLMGGLLYVFIQTIRNQPASAGDVFMGFRKSFVQLFLGYLVPALLAGVCFIPAAIVALICFLPAMSSHVATDPSASAVAVIIVAALICLAVAIFLSINWVFTLPLIMDKQMDFWPAMKASWKMVRKHWWQVFGLFVLMGLLNLAGMLACCVGVLFTVPIGLGAWMYAYETIFSPPKTG